MQLTTKKFPLRCYSWSGWSLDHKKISGDILAHSITLARLELAQQNISVTFIRRDITLFIRQLATLINGGIALVQALDILLQAQHHFKLQQLILSLKKDIEAGNPLAHAMRTLPDLFDPMTCQLTHIAEQTGTLDSMLMRHAHYQEKTSKLYAKLKHALIYPGFILMMALMITTAMLVFVVPRFVEIFANFQIKLPALTLHVIHLSHFILNDYWLSPLSVLLYYLIRYFYRKSLPYKKIIDALLLKLPWFGTLLTKLICARFSRTLATMLTAGLSITNALSLLVGISANNTFRTALQQLHTDINSGQRIHHALQAARVFPTMLVQMVKIGEESGSLEHMLEKIAEFYEADINNSINSISHLLEPLIIMILGVLIGGIVIAMYLPIFKLGTVI
jgi:type IV pilus assembly protein PilC